MLLLASSPFAILFEITEIVIYSFESQVFWTFAHIGEEIGEVMPVIANSYATASITLITFIIFIVTSFFHIAPNAVRSCFMQAMSSAVSITNASAPTRFGISRFEIRNFSFNLIAAITLTKPMNFISAATSENALITDCYKLIKSSIGYIGKVAHVRILAQIKE